MSARPFRAVGPDTKVCEPVAILKPENVSLGGRVMISEFVFLAGGAGTHIGHFVHVASHVSVVGGGLCLIEDFAGICSGARLITGTDKIDGSGLPGPTIPKACRSFVRSFVRCGRHSFIGTNAVVLPGITVGEGAVVASGAVVTKDLEPWGIYVGSPARRVKDRPQARIRELEARAYAEAGLAPSDFSAVIAELARSGPP